MSKISDYLIEMQSTDEYWEGHEADGRASNPYPSDTYQRDCWNAGYADAMDEATSP